MYEVEKSIGFLLSKGFQRSWGIMREELEPYELTPPQFGLLAFLWQQDGLTQVELAERGQIDRSTVGGLIDRLERSALLERRPHPQDRRAYCIYLTERGKELEAPLTACAERTRLRLTTGLTEEEINELRRMLEIIRGDRSIYEFPTC